MKPSGLYVNRWTKYGHDRLYLETADGRKVGWYDLTSHKLHVDGPADRRAADRAVKEWRAGRSPARIPRQRQSATPDTDLADRKAGEGIQAIADRKQIQNRLIRVLARILGIRTADTSWRIGAKGERRVGRRLDKLKKRGWHVLHNVELPGGGDVDHLLIGPGGVWTVNTKHHPGAEITVDRQVLLVRGYRHEYPAAAKRESQRVAEVLRDRLARPVAVSAMIVVHGHDRLQGWTRQRPLGVVVLPSWIARWFFRLPSRTRLSPPQVEAIFAVARRSRTWQRT